MRIMQILFFDDTEFRGNRLTLTKYFRDQFSQVSLTKQGLTKDV